MMRCPVQPKGYLDRCRRGPLARAMMTILIVEGDGDLQEALGGRLLRRGFEVVRARDESQALRCFQTKNPRLVITGTGQDSGDPLRVPRQIRQWDRRVPIILIPKDSSEDLAIDALKTGINEYLREPVSDDEVEEAIQRCLALSPAARTRAGAAPAKPAGGTRMIGQSGTIGTLKAQLLRI